MQKRQRQKEERRTPRAPEINIVTSTTSLPGDYLRDHSSYEGIELSDCPLDDQAAEQIVFQQAHLKHVGLARTELLAPELVDVRIEACNLAGVQWQKAHLNGVELSDSSLVGARFSDAASIDDTVIRGCNCELAFFWKTRFRVVRFERCNLRRAAFTDADLSGVVFHECEMTGTDLRGAKLTGADFRTSTITGIVAEPGDVRGAIIAPEQAVDLVELLGVTLKEDYE
jgi:uncharacterized protein YjbI with pentapeptide repeats